MENSQGLVQIRLSKTGLNTLSFKLLLASIIKYIFT